VESSDLIFRVAKAQRLTGASSEFLWLRMRGSDKRASMHAEWRLVRTALTPAGSISANVLLTLLNAAHYSGESARQQR
jgi:hypothetical protein